MPIAFVKRLAKKHGVSVSTAEGRWEHAKSQAAKQGREDDYGYITGIFKNMMSESESKEYLNEVRKAIHFTDFKDWNEAAKKAGYTVRGPFIPSVGDQTNKKYSAADKQGYVQGDFEVKTEKGMIYMYEAEEETSGKKYKENLIARRAQVRKIYNDFKEKGKSKKEFVNHLVHELGMKEDQANFWWWNSSPKDRDKSISDKDEQRYKEEKQPHKATSHDADEPEEMTAESIFDAITEKAVSTSQQHFMGMVHAAKKGELDTSKLRSGTAEKVKKAAKSMSDTEAEKYASTKHKGLPTHVKEHEFYSTFKEFLVMEMKEPETIKKLVTKAKKASYGKPLK